MINQFGSSLFMSMSILASFSSLICFCLLQLVLAKEIKHFSENPLYAICPALNNKQKQRQILFWAKNKVKTRITALRLLAPLTSDTVYRDAVLTHILISLYNQEDGSDRCNEVPSRQSWDTALTTMGHMSQWPLTFHHQYLISSSLKTDKGQFVTNFNVFLCNHIHNKNQINIRWLWPWTLTFGHPKLISSSQSSSGRTKWKHNVYLSIYQHQPSRKKSLHQHTLQYLYNLYKLFLWRFDLLINSLNSKQFIYKPSWKGVWFFVWF